MGTAPDPPTSFVISAENANSQTLTWVDSADEVYYIVEHSADNSTWVPLSLLQAGVLTTVQTGLSSETTYYYRIRSVGDEGLSAWVEVSGDTAAPELTTANQIFNWVADNGFTVGTGNWTDQSVQGNTLAHNTGALPTVTDPWNNGREAVVYSTAYAQRTTITGASNWLRYQSGTAAYKGWFFFVGSFPAVDKDGIWLYNVSSADYHCLSYRSTGAKIVWGSFGSGSYQEATIASSYSAGTKFVFGLNYQGSATNFVSPWRFNATSGTINHNPGTVLAIDRMYMSRMALSPNSGSSITVAQCAGYTTAGTNTEFDNNFEALGSLWGIATS